MNAMLDITQPSDTEILIQREFAAPPDLVFRAWTEPEIVRRWWAGHRGRMEVCEIDLRVGGRYRFVLTADGSDDEVGFHGEFREIVAGERIVQTEVYEAMGPSPDGDVVNVITFVPTDAGTRVDILVQCPTIEVRDGMAASGFEVGVAEQYEIMDGLLPDLAAAER